MEDAGIIRNKAKIAATINNANAFLAVQREFGSFAAYQWQFVDYYPIVRDVSNSDDVQATSPQSDAFAKDLKKRGFKFLGSTTVYAHMQACGMVNDHHNECFRKSETIALYDKKAFESLKNLV
jgi:DNA-3-methyladenine glycosylase I